ncbi:hypothetical protein LZF95_20065 [Algoriphagus sp. AGSA1]|uniref:hypothetical protein n=1 Tax=Algoriphagus sp. AGSA1 TaxID=2907213 RepID=UPI001F475372|nr:hypothetical protein [Algoriphagus sp. AGSA1]MCE7056986.1 hypothetical protein [Algoriphagus sp. AGSA1]
MKVPVGDMWTGYFEIIIIFPYMDIWNDAVAMISLRRRTEDLPLPTGRPRVAGAV